MAAVIGEKKKRQDLDRKSGQQKTEPQLKRLSCVRLKLLIWDTPFEFSNTFGGWWAKREIKAFFKPSLKINVKARHGGARL